MNAQTLQRIEQVLGYHFQEPALIVEALSHSSQVEHRLHSNERMEFLGDSVLSLVICQKLYEQFRNYLEGDMTRIKSRLVSRKTCARIAGDLDLASFAKVGKGVDPLRAMGGSIAAGLLEAVIAAIYIDGGLEPARDFILRLFAEELAEADAQQHQENFKSVLQQHAQRHFGQTPNYELLDEKGPDHNKCFEISVVIGRHRYPSAWGVTKKEAEQRAALNALVALELIEPEPE